MREMVADDERTTAMPPDVRSRIETLLAGGDVPTGQPK
jgi:hypothetical protein